MYFLKYRKASLPIIIDFAVIKNVCAKLNIKLSDFERTIDNPEQTEVICYEGLKRGHRLEQKELTITEQEVEDVLSDNYGMFLKIFSECVLKMFTVPTEDNKKK